VAIGEGTGCSDDDGTWAAVREISDSGAILVRPDNHVAYRSIGAVPDAADALTGALSTVLAR
jgi:2,4-dichlorophenol 6-monooxygenase